MSTLAEIEAAVETLPRRQQQALLHHLATRLIATSDPSISVLTAMDGLPVIRTDGATITADLVREIEGLVR